MLGKLRTNKIDGALGAMIIDDQPTHSIYYSMLSDYVNFVKNQHKEKQ